MCTLDCAESADREVRKTRTLVVENSDCEGVERNCDK